MNNTPAEQHLDLSSLLYRLWQWKWILLGVSFICAGISLVFSLMQPPKYLSFATVFPAKGDERDATLDGPDFGFDIHSERLIQMFDSETLRDSVIQHFDLAQHYGIDATEADWRDQLLRHYFKNIKFNKTLYSSVVISVRDTDPKLAAEIANYIADVVNDIHANMIHASTLEGIGKLENAIREKEIKVHHIEDTLRSLKARNLSMATGALQGQVSQRSQSRADLLRRLDQLSHKHNITQLDNQLSICDVELAHARSQFLESSGKLESLERAASSAITDSLLLIFRAEKEGASRRIAYYEQQINALMAVNSEYLMLRQQLQTENELLSSSESAYNELKGQFDPELKSTQLMVSQENLMWELRQLNELRRKYEVAQVALVDPTPAAYMISAARPTYKKTSPTTLLNTVLAFAFGLFCTVIFLFVAERTRIALGQMRRKT